MVNCVFHIHTNEMVFVATSSNNESPKGLANRLLSLHLAWALPNSFQFAAYVQVINMQINFISESPLINFWWVD